MKTIKIGRIEIRERIVRRAYARNGNVDRPTLIKAWDIYDGNRLIVSCHTLRDAKVEAKAVAR